MSDPTVRFNTVSEFMSFPGSISTSQLICEESRISFNGKEMDTKTPRLIFATVDKFEFVSSRQNWPDHCVVFHLIVSPHSLV